MQLGVSVHTHTVPSRQDSPPSHSPTAWVTLTQPPAQVQSRVPIFTGLTLAAALSRPGQPQPPSCLPLPGSLHSTCSSQINKEMSPLCVRSVSPGLIPSRLAHLPHSSHSLLLQPLLLNGMPFLQDLTWLSPSQILPCSLVILHEPAPSHHTSHLYSFHESWDNLSYIPAFSCLFSLRKVTCVRDRDRETERGE